MWLVTRAEGHGEASLRLVKVSIEIDLCKLLNSKNTQIFNVKSNQSVKCYKI